MNRATQNNSRDPPSLPYALIIHSFLIHPNPQAAISRSRHIILPFLPYLTPSLSSPVCRIPILPNPPVEEEASKQNKTKLNKVIPQSHNQAANPYDSDLSLLFSRLI